jgi:hypothetical protein
MDPMDPMDKYLVIAKYLSIGSIGSIFFFNTYKKKMDPMDPMDKYLVIAKYLSIGPSDHWIHRIHLFFLILIKKNGPIDSMDPMDKYLVIAKYLSIGSIRSIGSIFFFFNTY